MFFKAILFSSFSLSSLVSFAKNTNYSAVDSFVISVSFPINSLEDYDSLLSIFNDRFGKEEEKVRAVFFWVTENIGYDGEGLYSGKMITKKEEALRNKRCVCAGYADLLDYSFRKFGLASEYLTGTARLLDEKLQWNPDSWLNGHAWNAVKVNDQWKLMDATWASGYLSGRDFTKKRDDFWFFTVPELFLLSHFPRNSFFQLSGNRITQKEFYDQPYSLWEFYKSGITSITPRKLILKGMPGDAIPLSLTGTKEMNTAILRDEWGNIVQTMRMTKEGNNYIFYFQTRYPKQGKYYLGVGYVDEKRRYVWTADYVLAYFLSFTNSRTTVSE